MWKINEIFYSIQGEGFHTGNPAVFIRFSGCNLNCSFCDTNHQEGKTMSLYEVINEVKRYPNAKMVVLTGGEPSLFVNQALIDALKRNGKYVAIETNGTHALPEGIDWITLSPKSSLAGGDSAPVVLTECNELKVVYLGQDLKQYAKIKAEHRFLQPCYCDDDDIRQYTMRSCLNAVLNSSDWRLSLQTQRVLNIK